MSILFTAAETHVEDYRTIWQRVVSFSSDMVYGGLEELLVPSAASIQLSGRLLAPLLHAQNGRGTGGRTSCALQATQCCLIQPAVEHHACGG